MCWLWELVLKRFKGKDSGVESAELSNSQCADLDFLTHVWLLLRMLPSLPCALSTKVKILHWPLGSWTMAPLWLLRSVSGHPSPRWILATSSSLLTSTGLFAQGTLSMLFACFLARMTYLLCPFTCQLPHLSGDSLNVTASKHRWELSLYVINIYLSPQLDGSHFEDKLSCFPTIASPVLGAVPGIDGVSNKYLLSK